MLLIYYQGGVLRYLDKNRIRIDYIFMIFYNFYTKILLESKF